MIVIVFIIRKKSNKKSLESKTQNVIKKNKNLITMGKYDIAIQNLEIFLGTPNLENSPKVSNIKSLLEIGIFHSQISEVLNYLKKIFEKGQIKDAKMGLNTLSTKLQNNKDKLNALLRKKIVKFSNAIRSKAKQNIRRIKLEIRDVSSFMEKHDYEGAIKLLTQRKTEAASLGLKSLANDIENQINSITSFNKLLEIFKISNKVKLDDVQKILEMNREDLLNSLMEWEKDLKGFKIEGDYLIMKSPDNLKGLMGVIDEQFKSWEIKEQSKEGKIEDFDMDDFIF
jgi:hypothetical protein